MRGTTIWGGTSVRKGPESNVGEREAARSHELTPRSTKQDLKKGAKKKRKDFLVVERWAKSQK